MLDTENLIRRAATAENRLDLWTQIAAGLPARSFCEVGVFRGDFAAHLLARCGAIERYTMIDPWRSLENWKKPANRSDEEFGGIFAEAMSKTEAFADRREVIRDTTSAASGQIADGSLDMVYVDADHTLRGITIDLIKMLPKVRPGGIIAGDDFTQNVWQHGPDFSPTEVFPFAVYFAEAHGLPVFSLPFNQFCILNQPAEGFRFVDLAGYADLEPRDIYAMPRPSPAQAAREALARVVPDSMKSQIRSILGQPR